MEREYEMSKIQGSAAPSHMKDKPRKKEHGGVPEHVDGREYFYPYSRCAQIIINGGGDELKGGRSLIVASSKSRLEGYATS